MIGRLLTRLVNGDPADLDVVVVCNGCSDATATVAGAFPGVRVVQTPVPSKAEALRLGDLVAPGFPRVYVDADVEIDQDAILRLAKTLIDGPFLAASPARVIPKAGVAWPVRWYYTVWEELPQVRGGIFGRGVIALSEAGYQRIRTLPALMSDDLAMSAAFSATERCVEEAALVVVHPPRTWNDLIRRRVRAATGTAQAYTGDHGLRTDARTSRTDLIEMCRRRPGLLLRMPVFVAVAVLARRRARRALRQGDFGTWLRDESSRDGPAS